MRQQDGVRLVDGYNDWIQVSIDEEKRSGRIVEEKVECKSGDPKWGYRRPFHRLGVDDLVSVTAKNPATWSRVRCTTPDNFLPCTDVNLLCPACRAFGMVSSEKESNLPGYRGHIRPGWALAEPAAETTDILLPALMSPKPSHGPFCLAPKDDMASGWNQHAEQDIWLSGRKLYWHGDPAQATLAGDRPDLQKTVEALPAVRV